MVAINRIAQGQETFRNTLYPTGLETARHRRKMTGNNPPLPSDELDAGPGSGVRSVAAGRGSGERLRAIIEHLPDGIVIVDPGGHIRFANPAAERLFNRASSEIVGTDFGFPVFAGDTTEIDVVQRGGGDVVHAELRVVETEWEGQFAKLVSIRDITDRKQAEERTRQLAAEREARLEAEAASRAKSEFLAIMSHELRTPLNAVLGYSELMELGLSGPLTDEMREQIGRIRASAKHLLALVNDILDLAKVEAGRLEVARDAASTERVVASAIALVQPQATAREIDLSVETGADSPVFIGDEERVRQILVNLLSNAVKFTPPAGKITVNSGMTRAPEKEARLQPQRDYVCIRVTDTGDGIPEGKLARIFEPFVQADAGTTRSKQGSGLGLTISRRLARLMGGDLTLQSEPGKGSAFTLWLPTEQHFQDAEAKGDARSDSASDRRDSQQRVADVGPRVIPERRVEGLADVGVALLSRMDATLSAIVARIRSDPSLAMAAGLKNSQIADHLSTFLADVAGALIIIDESGGKHSKLLADGIEIQRLISERHGAQRMRLGWTEAALRREFMIIREEIERVVLSHLGSARLLDVKGAVAIFNRFLDHSEFVAVRSLEGLREK